MSANVAGVQSLIRKQSGARRADLSRVLASYDAFKCVIKKIAEPFRADQVGLVLCIETSGIAFGCAVADYLKTGFVIMRKLGRERAWRTVKVDFDPNYSSMERGLELVEGAINKGHRVLIVDDFLEHGEQMRAAIKLLEQVGAIVVGAAFFQANITRQGALKFPNLKIRDFYNDYEIQV